MSEVEKLQTLHQVWCDFIAIRLLVQIQQRRLATAICSYTAVTVTTSLLYASPLMCLDSPQASSCLVTFSFSFLVRNYPLPIPPAVLWPAPGICSTALADVLGQRALRLVAQTGIRTKTRRAFCNFLFLHSSNCIQ